MDREHSLFHLFAAKAVRATVTGIEDTVPDDTGRYWYWLKLTTATNTVTNIGPFEAVETK